MDIYIQKDGQQLGPFEEEKVRSGLAAGEFASTDLAWREGEETWRPISDVFESGAPASNPSAKAFVATTTADAAASKAGVLEPAEKKTASLTAIEPKPVKTTKSRRFLLKTTLVHSSAAAVLGDLKTMDLKSEVLPLDEQSLSVLRKDFVFWSAALLAVVPLFLVTLRDTNTQLTGFALFFAFIWGVIFKRFVIEDAGAWKLPLAALFFTGLLGLFLLSQLYHLLPTGYLTLSDSTNLVSSLFGFVFQVGLCEEICKILPVIFYLAWKRRNANPFTLILIGVFSGLGFAAFENLGYAQNSILTSAKLIRAYGEEGLVAGVQGAMINVLLRSISSVFGHAVYSGIFAYFIAQGFAARRRLVALFIVGWAVSAIIHGLYDWLWKLQVTLPAVLTGFAFMLFYAYLTKLRILVAQSSQSNTQANVAAVSAPEIAAT